ncbi:MAG: aldo/keto reductase, partial [Desulfobacteraceae bacterium]|nr:aldo/keto reductase [Desulfobacteraceae bacterium]
MQENPIYDPFQEEDTHLTDYLIVLRKRKKLIILVFILVVLATLYATYKADPVYQSSAKLIIEKESSSSPITGERIDHESGRALEMTFNTNIKMMTSAPVIRRLIIALKLDTENNNKDLEVSFIKGVISQLKTNIKLLLKKDDVKHDIKEINDDKLQNRKMQNLIASMKNKISVGQIMNTRLLNLS